jgi:Uri superfamily endonuclease
MNDIAGTYLLVLASRVRRRLQVGRLGEMQLEPGCYLYIGSAFGPGGIAARLKHHRAISRKPHWHIDYLRRHCDLTSAWCVYGRRLECDWAQRLGSHPAYCVPLPRFGASDCRCGTHLLYADTAPSQAKLQRLLGSRLQRVD